MDLHSTPGAGLLSTAHLTIPQTDAIVPDVIDTWSTTPKSLTPDRLEALLQMQKTDPFCKCISKWLSKRIAPKHEADLFLHVKGLLYKHITDSHQKILGFCDPQAIEVHSISGNTWFGHQGATQSYCFIKFQYYWKCMNKDIRKYIAQCTLCCREKAKVQAYPLQMTEIPEYPFDKIVIDLVAECETSSSGNNHTFTIIDHLTGWPQVFPYLISQHIP